MLVSLTFEKDGLEYHIERGRRPNFLKFSINGLEQHIDDLDESQGDSRQTQKVIEQVIGMSHDMFKHLIALNTYTEPFLSMRTNDQRAIIEQLLGITQLSEKAEILKEQIKKTKDEIVKETTKIETIRASNEKIQQSIDALERKQKLWDKTHTQTLNELTAAIQALTNINIEKEIENQRLLTQWNQQQKSLTLLNKTIASTVSALEREQKNLVKLEKELTSLADHRCHSCGQELHDTKHDELLNIKKQQYQECKNNIHTYQEEFEHLQNQIDNIGNIGPQPFVEYNSFEQALEHRSTLEHLENSLATKQKDINPYSEQIYELAHTAFQNIDWQNVNQLTKDKEHQEFLYKLLTNKDSFIRKSIIDQNLLFLNQRLTHYLTKIGLPHMVEFQNDLSVLITQLGQDFDFDNLSRGERNRLILSLSWAFRDVWESLYHPINLLFIDELIDSGLDASGVESSISILKQMVRNRNRSTYLISHRDDLGNRVDQILKVIKENGFTRYSVDREIV
jgi:DNA repair exonuclease SbcCD ATPase subunit